MVGLNAVYVARGITSNDLNTHTRSTVHILPIVHSGGRHFTKAPPSPPIPSPSLQ